MFSHFFNLILGNDSVSTTLRVSKHRIFTVFIRKCACVCACVCVCVRVCACACLCERERDRDCSDAVNR